MFDVLLTIRIAQAQLAVAVNTTATTAVRTSVGMAPKLQILAGSQKAKTTFATITLIITVVKDPSIVVKTAVVLGATAATEKEVGRSIAVVKIYMDIRII